MNLRFRYVNHRGDDHEYVVHPIRLSRPDAWWSLEADVVTRDGDPRPEMGDNRRRTFRLSSLRNVEDVWTPGWTPAHMAASEGKDQT